MCCNCKLQWQHRLYNHIYSFSYRWEVIYFAIILLQIQGEGRSKVRSSLTPSTAQLALQRILPYPCKKQYTAVILMPKSSPFKFLKSVFQSTRTNGGREAKVCSSRPLVEWFMPGSYILNNHNRLSIFSPLQILAGIAGLAVLALSLWRHSRSGHINSRHLLGSATK